MPPEIAPSPASAPDLYERMEFCFPWRSYQQRVLQELDQHLEDRHLHVVAAPGSGKTVLGIEVVRRLNQPALILSPTLTIRNQWVDRLVQLFLPDKQRPEGISTTLRQPGIVTSSTYQALHMAFTGKRDDTEEEETDEEGAEPAEDAQAEAEPGDLPLVEALTQAGVKTLVVDECHHLRTEWWKSLIAVKNHLPDLTVVALTATPPYDVPPPEWENYRSLCGPIDAEISVPELVRERNLCPHQDYVYLSMPSAEEQARIDEIRGSSTDLLKSLTSQGSLWKAVRSTAAVQSPDAHVERILEDPEFYSSVIIYLNAVEGSPPPELLNVMGLQGRRIPLLDRTWMQALLTGCLFSHADEFSEHEDYLQDLKRTLARLGVVERRKVELDQPAEISKTLTRSISKLDSIREIASVEYEALGDDLRMVVLTDFIRKEDMPSDKDDRRPLTRLGVVPIFEMLRRWEAAGSSLGILCGSLIVIPTSTCDLLLECAASLGTSEAQITVTPLAHDPAFSRVEMTQSDEHHSVHLMTTFFQRGGVRVLVGTAALLGEGWDAPFVNTLVLASYVGSFMLSNQMRGRAIRSVSGDPEKTANIWHLAAVEAAEKTGGADLETLRRRFAAFVGVSADGERIENGMHRLELPGSPYLAPRVQMANTRTFEQARDRERLRDEWKAALLKGDGIVEEVEVASPLLPRRSILNNTLLGLLYEAAMISFYLFLETAGDTNSLGPAVVVAALVGLPFALKALWLFLKHGTVETSMRTVGEVIKKSLHAAGTMKSPLADLKVHASRREDYTVSVWLTGGSSYERALFQDAVNEFMGPVENPRYVLVRYGQLWFVHQKDYHSVPRLLGQRKEQAECLRDHWRSNVGGAELVYTRNTAGRKALLRAREHSMAHAFQSRAERRSAWR